MRWVSIYDDRVLNQDSGLHLIHGINRPVVVGSWDCIIFEAARSVRFPITRPRSIEGFPLPHCPNPQSPSELGSNLECNMKDTRKGANTRSLSSPHSFLDTGNHRGRKGRTEALQKQAMLPSNLSLLQVIGELEFLRHHHPK